MLTGMGVDVIFEISEQRDIKEPLDVLQSHFSDVHVLDFVSSAVQFTGYTVNSTKSTSQPSVLSPPEAIAVMPVVTDVAIANYMLRCGDQSGCN